VSGSGANSASAELQVSFTVTVNSGIESAESQELRAVSIGGELHVSGLIPGETLSIYSIQGQLSYKSKATATEQTIRLRERGVYIVVAGERRVKTVY
jgi:hypothetical protein